MMKILQRIIFCILTCIGFTACQDKAASATQTQNSIYYWRTTFSFNKKEKEFLKTHDITKIYMRFFDVDFTYTDQYDEMIIPQATILFNDTIPAEIEVVPTVYITTWAIEKMQTKEEEYAEKIYKRVNAICRRNNIAFNELQLDCDWAKGTRQPFFRLCEAMKEHMDSTQTLSSTIRLHQLTQSPPPVDKGVLMVYNTGNLMKMTSDNSIFSRKDIEPYLKDNRLAKYPLTLDVAYPAFGWSLVFHPGNDGYYFDRIMRRTDFSNYPSLKKIESNLYEATSTISFPEDTTGWDKVYQNYRIRVERPKAGEILEIKKLIDMQLKGKSHNNIIYHLDDAQLSHYSDNEISKIYSRR